MPTKAVCRYCGRTLTPWREPEPDDEAICGTCEEQRTEAQRDAAAEAKGDERRDNGGQR